jgi:hypothetical protein
MPVYNCAACNFSTKIRTNFISHLKTKKHVKKTKEDGFDVLTYAQNTNKNPQKPSKTLQNPPILEGHKNFRSESENGEYQKLRTPSTILFSCKYCNKTYTRQDNLKRHMDTRCKGREISEVIKVRKVNNDFEKIYKKEIEESRLERMENNRILCKLIEKVGNTNITHNNNCGNTQTNNVQLNNFGHEDLSMLTDNYMRKMVSLPYTAIPKMIKKIHFNDKYPENRNIRMLNKKDNKLQIRNNGEWKYVDKKDTIQLLIEDKNYHLDQFYEQNKETFEYKFQHRFNKFQDQITEDNKLVNKEINKDTELIFWNSM